MSHEELLMALENIIIDKVTTHSVFKVRKIDTSAPLEIGMAEGSNRAGKGQRQERRKRAREWWHR